MQIIILSISYTRNFLINENIRRDPSKEPRFSDHFVDLWLPKLISNKSENTNEVLINFSVNEREICSLDCLLVLTMDNVFKSSKLNLIRLRIMHVDYLDFSLVDSDKGK